MSAPDGKGGNGERGPNTELMRAMGSPNGSDPIPPTQYLYFLDGADPFQRALAWIRSKTIRHGHRKHYAVDQNGNPLYIQNLADDCFNGHWGNANRTWQQLESQKLVARADDGKLCLCGNVPSHAAQCKSLENQFDTDKAPLCTEFSKLCTEWSPPAYLREELERRDHPEREDFAAQCLSLRRWADKIEAEAIAAARAVVAEKEKALFDRFHLPKRTVKRTDEPAPKPWVQLTLLVDFDSVQTDSVQAGSGPLYSAENSCVQTVPSLSLSEQRKYSEKTSPSGRAEALEVKALPQQTPPPARPPVVVALEEPKALTETQDPAWRSDLYDWLRTQCPVPTLLDDGMYARIVRWLRLDLLEQFKEAATAVEAPRKWAIFEAIAKQVFERGKAPPKIATAKTGNGEDSILVQLWRQSKQEIPNG